MYATLHQMSTQNGKLLNIKLEMKTNRCEHLRILREVMKE